MATKIIVQRDHEVAKVTKPKVYSVEPSTVGILKIYENEKEIYSCYTIENGGESSSKPGMDKRIMPGIYRLTYSYTSVPLPIKLNKQGLLLNDPNDPAFAKRRIFIHMGNYPQDTLGCLLLAKKYDMSKKPGIGFSSRIATLEFYAIIDRVGIQQTTLLIKEIEHGTVNLRRKPT